MNTAGSGRGKREQAQEDEQRPSSHKVAAATVSPWGPGSLFEVKDRKALLSHPRDELSKNEIFGPV